MYINNKMSEKHKQAPKGVRLKWASLKEAKSVSFSRDSSKGAWVVRVSGSHQIIKPCVKVKYEAKASSGKNYLIP